MQEREKNGTFAKGNSCSKAGYMKKERIKIRREAIDSALLMTTPYCEIDDRLSSPSLTNLQYLTLTSVRERDVKFISWLLEMAVGKPAPFRESAAQATNTLESLILGKLGLTKAEEDDEEDEL